MNASCGIDFGTSNSSVALATREGIRLAPVEGTHVTIPSALFFGAKDNTPTYGREAVSMFFARRPGRFMRSLKRVLGTSLMKQGTMVNGKVMKFEKIITPFLKNLKDRADATSGLDLQHVVMGRPVHFVDNAPDADSRAQAELKAMAEAVGFRYVDFQFEPIAAAFAHEANVSGEKLALVADLGGGTSDFTVIRLSNAYVKKADRTSDILANTGVRIGGNDFDKDLSLSAILPELGYRSTYGEKHLEVPLKPYHDLAEWSKVNVLYTTKTVAQTRQLLYQSHDKKRFGRLLTVLEQETGHALLASAEETKIALTSAATYQAPFEFIEPGFFIDVPRQLFEESIRVEIEKIAQAATQCIHDAGVGAAAIELVILTGGSTEVPRVQEEFRRLFPNAALADENKLSSVGLGLAYDSRNKFG
ncbi:Hsp70 family protein [Parachryseolinea silvisoli]|uniref:Hsp70 family protein n=1 Tax=Parachryseolinea silvisoli TaxID=2873601 RepID=UPI002265D273|nr:Hsp70 family protein [Parachryseolinea silvisoli]MCD9018470.1 Hsp70 family protein [Parachryseolinea silvisoli]